MICQLICKVYEIHMQTSYFRHLKEVERFQKTKRSCSTVTLWLLVIYTPSLPWTHDLGWVSNPPKSKWSSPVKKGKDHLNHHKTIRKPSKPGVLRNADVFVLEKVQDSKPLRTPRKDWDFPHAIGFDWLETVPYVLYTFVYLKIHMTSAQSTAVEIQHGNFQRVHASFIGTFSIMPRIYTVFTEILLFLIPDHDFLYHGHWCSSSSTASGTQRFYSIYMYWQFKQTELYMHMPV